MIPCLRCGEPSPSSYCEEHKPRDRKTSARARGYDTEHDRLSRRARRLQPFCGQCGSTEDLQLDHGPQTWARKAEGKPLRLTDYRGVVCGDCNRDRGDARDDPGRSPLDPSSGPRGKPQTQLRMVLNTSVVANVPQQSEGDGS